jgi:hypothetical protein
MSISVTSAVSPSAAESSVLSSAAEARAENEDARQGQAILSGYRKVSFALRKLNRIQVSAVTGRRFRMEPHTSVKRQRCE